MQGGAAGKGKTSADSCLVPTLLPNHKRLPNGPEPVLGHPSSLLAKSQSQPGIDQSPGAKPGPPKGSWELNQKQIPEVMEGKHTVEGKV